MERQLPELRDGQDTEGVQAPVAQKDQQVPEEEREVDGHGRVGRGSRAGGSRTTRSRGRMSNFNFGQKIHDLFNICVRK